MNGFQTFIGVEDFKTVEILRNLFGEFLGTFLYVFVGVMSTVSLSKSLITSVIPVAFAFGLSLSTVLHVVQRASGAHLNPAISISCLVVGEIKFLKCLCYILVQCCGASSGALSVVIIASRQSLDEEDGVSHPLFVGVWAALVVEICITFLMVIVFKAMNDPTRNDLNLSGPLVVGLSVASGHLVGYLLSSSSMNPARSFGPALVNLDFKYHWIYWIGPILGGVLGAIYYAFGMQDREALKRYYSRRNVSRKSSIRSIT
ncbi:aquaporin-like [Ceratitis capitata]|uniref:aquaporin-like n=1 Tax=Ceratitis capitata TaxID=7213 RepID=UPI000329C1D0|nr:aquaporin-like [Ceratitis capitata]